MKKILLIIALVLISVTAMAESSFQLVERGYPAGQVRISMSDWDKVLYIPVCIQSDLSYDEFHINVESASPGIDVIGWCMGEWTSDPVYLDQYGEPHNVTPFWETDGSWCRAKLLESGFEADASCYGTVKWKAGIMLEMAILKVKVEHGFVGGSIRLAGYLAAGPDSREYEECVNGVLDVDSESVICLGREAGDVNGDGEVTIADVTALIDSLMGEQ